MFVRDIVNPMAESALRLLDAGDLADLLQDSLAMGVPLSKTG
jgi:hypothetical protein